MYKGILSIMLVLAMINIQASAIKITVGEFSQMKLSGWNEKSFSGDTSYQLVDDEGLKYLQASANATASALFKKVKVDLNITPYLNWSWRVDQSLQEIDEQTKRGDDYAARVYVIVKRGLAPWKTNALNYVWSSDVQPDEFWFNAYTDKAMMIPLRNRNDDESWQHEKVNVKQDFKKYFGLDVSNIDGVAIMTDTDNSQLSAIASYGDIYFTAD